MHQANTEMVAATPAPQLQPWVTRYTGYHVPWASGLHRGLPSQYLTLVVALEGTVDLAGPGVPLSGEALISGLHQAPVQITQNGPQFGIHIDLTPLGARAFFGLPAGALARTVLRLDMLLGRDAEELLDRLRTATGWIDRFGHLDAVFTRLAGRRQPPLPELAWAWHQLGRGSRVQRVATELGWSRQRLRTRFDREFGLTPKQLHQLARFNAARELLRGPCPPPLAEVAVRCGFSDQAHLTRQWRALTGITPSAWLAERVPSVQDEGSAASGH